MAKPSVGRIVHYFPGPHDRTAQVNGLGSADPVAAVVVRVWGDREDETLNLRLFLDYAGSSFTDQAGEGELGTPIRTSVVHKDNAAVDGSYWDWPERV